MSLLSSIVEGDVADAFDSASSALSTFQSSIDDESVVDVAFGMEGVELNVLSIGSTYSL